MFPSSIPLSHDSTGNPNSSLLFYNPVATNEDAMNQFYFEDILDDNYRSLIDQPSYQGSTPLDFAPQFSSINDQNPVLQDMTTASTGAYRDSSRLDEQLRFSQYMITAGSTSRSSQNSINFAFKPQPNSFHIDGCMRETLNVGSKIAFRMKTKLEVVDDGYKWRKYGKKKVKSSPYPRNYYHCAAIGCKVKKRIERDIDDPSYVITTYDGVHNHKRSS